MLLPVGFFELPLIVVYEYVRTAGFVLNAPRLKLCFDSRATKEVSQAAFHVILGCSQSDVIVLAQCRFDG